MQSLLVLVLELRMLIVTQCFKFMVLSRILQSDAEPTVTPGIECVGIITATGGFSSGIGTGVKISVSGNNLTFTVAGVGSTTLILS